MDKICLELGPSEEFVNAVLVTLTIRVKKCFTTSLVTFLNYVNETNGA